VAAARRVLVVVARLVLAVAAQRVRAGVVPVTPRLLLMPRRPVMRAGAVAADVTSRV
jgi:hypothetical protein